MATDRKTVTYCSDLYTDTVASNTTTAITMPTIYLPESSKTFRSVVAHVFWSDIVTATGSSYTVREIALGLGGGTKTTVTNASTYTNSGENIDGYFAQDLTSRFTTSWSGTSMTCEVDVRFTLSGGTFVGVTNVCIMLEIDYEYDDTSATQVKTIYYQLPTPNGTLATSKPASLETLPAFDTELPEASKVYRGKWVRVGGNRNVGGINNTTDASISIEMQSEGAATTQLFENALASDSHFTVILKPTWDTSQTRTWHIWGSSAFFRHIYCFAIITYEFDASASNDVYHSLLLPMKMDSPIGTNAEGNRQYGERDLWIAELGNITTKRTGCIFFWQQYVTQSTAMRIKAHPSDGWQQLADAAAVVCGSNAAQAITTSYTLTRGRQTLRAECYSTTATLAGGNLNCLWLVNYVAPKMSGGHGAHTKTRLSLARPTGTAAAAGTAVDAASAPFAVPQANHFVTAVGSWFRFVTNTTFGVSGFTYQYERLSTGGEGGVGWEAIYTDVGAPDAETGVYHMLAQSRSLFKRWPGDNFSGRVDLATSRRTRWLVAPQGAGTIHTGWLVAQTMVTYHTHTWTVAGTVKGSAGGTVTISLHRHATGEKVLETTRSGDGAFSFTWYDNTEQMFLVARDGSNVHRRFVSEAFLADSAVSHTLRMWHPRGPVIDAVVMKPGGDL